MEERTRREVGAGAVAVVAVTAGCLGGITGSSPPDVVVFNNADAERSLRITVAPEGGGDPLVDDATTVAGGDAAEYEDVLPGTGRFAFAVAVVDGPSATETLVVEDESTSLQAVAGENEIEFRRR